MAAAGEALALVEATRLTLLSLIGEGGCAQVFYAFLRDQTAQDPEVPLDPRPVAVKRIDLGDDSMMGFREQRIFDREVAALRALDHPNIVKLLGTQSQAKPLTLILELCCGGSLFCLLHCSCVPEVELSWAQQRKMCLDIARAMDHLHTRNPPILHRDLKSPNILLHVPLTGPGDLPFLKLADFGLARNLPVAGDMPAALGACHCEVAPRRLTGSIGTWQWMAPEVFCGLPYNTKADVYPFGIVLHEILSRVPPFNDEEPSEVRRKVVTGARPPLALLPIACPEDVQHLMQACWSRHATQRPDYRCITNVLESLA